MRMMGIVPKARGAWRRYASRAFGRRLFAMRNTEPVISFTFDDFPRSALYTAGAMLEEAGVAATYYTSFGLAGRETTTGRMFEEDDLAKLLEAGHEIGCHTFDHLDAYATDPREFEASVLRNRKAAAQFRQGIKFTSLSYPISGPRPATKRRCAKYFTACRSGGQLHNEQRIDLNALKSFFLEQSRDDLGAVRAVIDANARAAGWLIFSTHDVDPQPTSYGCVPEFFREVLDCAVQSGARLLPVSRALEAIGVSKGSGE